MKNIYIINTCSRSLIYGIGTYTKQLIDVLLCTSNNITVVTLFDDQNNEIQVNHLKGVRYISIPNPRNAPLSIRERSVYLRNVYYSLLQYININEEIIFHFNNLYLKELGTMFKNNLKCKIIATLHFTDWGLSLKGNKAELLRILQQSDSDDDLKIKQKFDAEYFFMNYIADYIIAIATHSFETLTAIYKIPKEKISLIPNGIKDVFNIISFKNRNSIKIFFNIPVGDKVVIFVGRLDSIKGCEYLIESFKKVLEKNSNVRLIIVGDGNISKLMYISFPYLTRIVFTGRLSESDLYKLYSIADLGVVPSLHEEFGYVAIEMMMHGLPIIANNTTGLSEIINDKYNGELIDLKVDHSISVLSNRIIQILNDPIACKRYSHNGRMTFLEKYCLEVFNDNINKFYERI